ncbi:MAG: putative thiol:disulfide oxidoreductase TlpB [Fluviicola sp.]|jgi:thiol-disulfide isomerase/thioredoxin|uniref:MauE/DoxX family redox-associated membrane protein n=1 Tax=Fluviicola sp. TaxID=1917219 RepID=UPI00261C895A|nr:MauE/DoxX family redox-associated membrane protein [Fluviicola sp.]MDF3026519.1 putative thiol:disulfide oxidoreductase TlpB [Fluviicola sp.]
MTTTGLEKQTFVNKQLPIIIKGLMAFMFLLSAVAKLYPSPNFALSTFEVKQLIPMGFSETSAAYFSRILIGCELALGLLLLQKNYFKRLVIPMSFLMLLVFSIHLSYEIASSGNSGNCGCFGTLLPMTPVQALIKNIIGMGLLVLLYQKTAKESDRLNFSFLAAVTFASILAVFLVGPMQRKSNDENEKLVEEMMQEMNMDDSEDNTLKAEDSTGVKIENSEKAKIVDPKDSKITKQETVPEEKPLADEPKAKRSGFASQFGDIDKGRKILCFFAPGCDHCKETAKALTELAAKDANFPEIKIVFMDEETELIPDFFAFAGKKYQFKILDVASFWTVLGGTKDTPGVFYLWNGNSVKEYDGINERAFKKDEFRKIVQKKWSELK